MTQKNECCADCSDGLNNRHEWCKNINCQCHQSKSVEGLTELQKLQNKRGEIFTAIYAVESDLAALINQAYESGYAAAVEEERQFILNILDGVDEADRQLDNTGGGTKAIRFALQSRSLSAKQPK